MGAPWLVPLAGALAVLLPPILMLRCGIVPGAPRVIVGGTSLAGSLFLPIVLVPP